MTDGNVTLSIPSAYKHPDTHPASMITGLATVATSGKYSDLSGKPSLAKVATSGSYNDLSNRPSIPATPKAYITATWKSGNSWYRKWSDGFIEQGGYASSVPHDGDLRITLHTAFATTLYTAMMTRVGYKEETPHVTYRGTTAVGFGGAWAGSSYGSFDGLWYACGY